MARYAKNTAVSVQRTVAEIEAQLTRFGAGGFYAGWQEKKRELGFIFNGRAYRYELLDRDDDRETRSMWRCLLLKIKGQLAWVADGYASFEQEFVTQLMLPNRRTVGDHLIEQLPDADSKLPKLLPM